MEFQRELHVRRPVADVWDFFRDVQKLAPCIPGLEDIKQTEAGNWEGVVVEGIGPFQVRFAVQVDIEEEDEATHTIKARLQGKDARLGSTLSQSMTVRLEPAENGDSTRVCLTTDVKILGKLGTLGQGLIRRKADSLMEQFEKNVTAALEGGAPDASPV